MAPYHGAHERDGYYAKDDPDHRDASAWAGKGADALGLSGPVDPDVFTAILEGRVPDGPGLGRRGKDGEIVHRPGRDLTLSAPKSVSLAALVCGDARVAEAHGRAVERTLAWIEERAVETRMKDPDGGGMIRAGDQKAVIATFTHETSRNLDPQLHTHAVIANMVQGADGKWRTMANEKLYSSKMLIGALYQGIRGARAPASLKRPAFRMTVIVSFLGGRSVDNLEQLCERCFADACPAHELLKLVHPFGIRKILDRDVLVDNGVIGIT